MPPDAPNVAVAPPSPAAPAAPADKYPVDHPLIRRLMDAVGSNDAPEKPEVTPKPEAPKPAPAAPVVAAAPDEPIRLRKEKLKRPEVPLDDPPPPPPRIAPSPAPAKPDPKWEEALDDESREMLVEARELEETLPDKYRGFSARTEKFLRELGERKKDEEFDPEAPEHRQWLDKNQPRLTRREIRDFESERVARKLKPEFESKYADLRHELFVRDETPKIAEEGKAVFAELSHSSLPDDVAEAIKTKGYTDAEKEYRAEIRIASNVLNAVTEDIVEFMRVTRVDPVTKRPLAKEATDPSDPKFEQHERLRTVMDQVCASFKAEAPQEQQYVGGKWFATRDEWKRMKPEHRAKFWTFENKDIVARAKLNVKGYVKAAIQQHRAAQEELGYVRRGAAAAPAPEPRPTPPPTPRASPTPGGNGATPAETGIDPRAARLAKVYSAAE